MRTLLIAVLTMFFGATFVRALGLARGDEDKTIVSQMPQASKDVLRFSAETVRDMSDWVVRKTGPKVEEPKVKEAEISDEDVQGGV